MGRGAPWAAPLSWLIPPRIALQILLTGDPITAQRGYEIGLVNEVVPLADLRSRAQAAGRADRRERPAVRAGRQAHRVPVQARCLRRGRADLGAGLPQRGRAGRARRVPRQAAARVDRPLRPGPGPAHGSAASLTATRQAGRNRPGAGWCPGAGLWAGSRGTTAMTRFRPWAELLVSAPDSAADSCRRLAGITVAVFRS